MRTNSAPDSSVNVLGRDDLLSLGVLVPIQFNPVRVLPGRHPLRRAGDGMRVLRTRPYIQGEDNPRDIDKFSPSNDRQVIEWEDEAQASVTLLVDMSASMASMQKAALRNATVMQLVYSLWRAGDRVGVEMFDSRIHTRIWAANLRSQMQRTTTALLSQPRTGRLTEVSATLNAFVGQDRRRHSNLLFVISDFVTDGENTLSPSHDWNDAINEVQQNIVPVIISFKVSSDCAGLQKLSDAERPLRRLVWMNRARIRAINNEERLRVADLEARFRAAGLDSMNLIRQDMIYPQLLHLARRRRQRRL
ncbi:MAG: hypothetical protein HKN77_04480 [Woeseiaceae bacterium]|nr:hypothetical protein [Woeseiaceae bacterium]